MAIATNKLELLIEEGYLQIRYNGLFESNPQLECEQCDENWGEHGKGFSFRRILFKIKGQISPRVFFYFQPDFARSIGGSHHVGQLKDAYIDLVLWEILIQIGPLYTLGNMQDLRFVVKAEVKAANAPLALVQIDTNE